jgi:hypothetical protein
MAEKEIFALSDKSVFPTDELIFSLIGIRKVFWQEILEKISAKHNDVSYSWNYYMDGHQWLFKYTHKKKTVFWGAIVDTGEFRFTFYFGDKAESAINSSSLPPEIIADFNTAHRFGKLRPISILVNSEQDVDSVLKIADIKIKLK